MCIKDFCSRHLLKYVNGESKYTFDSQINVFVIRTIEDVKSISLKLVKDLVIKEDHRHTFIEYRLMQKGYFFVRNFEIIANEIVY